MRCKPDEHVIAFRETLFRAATMSPAALANKNTLFSLNSYRDIIAHSRYSLLDEVAARTMLERNFIILCSVFARELQVPLNALIGKSVDELSTEADLRTATAQLDLLIDQAKTRWESIKDDQTIIVAAKARLDKRVSVPTRYNNVIGLLDYPSCQNDIFIHAEVDFDYDHDEGTSTPVGVGIDKAYCEYCGLKLVDPLFIDIAFEGKQPRWI